VLPGSVQEPWGRVLAFERAPVALASEELECIMERAGQGLGGLVAPQRDLEVTPMAVLVKAANLGL